MIAQLKYNDKKQAIQHLKEVGVLNDENEYTDITHAVVHVGKIVDEQGTYNEEGERLTPSTYLDGYHVDVMIKVDVDFGTYEVTPKTPRHKFA